MQPFLLSFGFFFFSTSAAIFTQVQKYTPLCQRTLHTSQTLQALFPCTNLPTLIKVK
jgi:hypothetical protein